MVVYMFVFHALGFLPSTLRQDSRHRVMWILSLVVHHLVPSPMVLVYPVGSEHPRGGKLRMVLETFGVEKNLSYLDEVTQKSPKTTCVVGFLVVTFHWMMIQNPQLKKHGETRQKTYQRKASLELDFQVYIFLRPKLNPFEWSFVGNFSQWITWLFSLKLTASLHLKIDAWKDELSVSHTIYVWYIFTYIWLICMCFNVGKYTPMWMLWVWVSAYSSGAHFFRHFGGLKGIALVPPSLAPPVVWLPYSEIASVYVILTRWWFQIVFIFTHIWGNDPSWLIFFKGVETTT